MRRGAGTASQYGSAGLGMAGLRERWSHLSLSSGEFTGRIIAVMVLRLRRSRRQAALRRQKTMIMLTAALPAHEHPFP